MFESVSGIFQAFQEPLPVNMENPRTGRKIRISFYCVKMTLLVNYFQKYTLKVPASSHFCEILESSKYRSISQNGLWNFRKIAHFTERRELAWISYSQSLKFTL